MFEKLLVLRTEENVNYINHYAHEKLSVHE